MKVSGSNYSYNNSSINTNTSSIRSSNIGNKFAQAYNIDISEKAKLNPEFNNPDNNYPTYNSEILQYSKNLNLTYK